MMETRESVLTHLYTHLCDYVFQDKSGKMGFLGVFHFVRIAGVGAPLPPFWIGIGLSLNARNIRAGDNVQVFVTSDSWEWTQPVTPPSPLDTIPDEARDSDALVLQFQEQLPGLFVPGSGRYYVEVRENGRVIHRAPFDVIEKAEGL